MSLYEGKILDYVWYSGKDCVGIVAVQRYEGWRAFIGYSRGGSEAEDLEYIKSWGAALPKEMAFAAFPDLPEESYVE